MLSFLVFSLVVIRGNAQSYCVWGQSGQNAALNGEYPFDSTYNGESSYVKTLDASCSLPTLYLFKHATFNTWWISVRVSHSLSHS